MPKTFRFRLPGITCGACIDTINCLLEEALPKNTEKTATIKDKIIAVITPNAVDRIISITVADADPPMEEEKIKDALKKFICDDLCHDQCEEITDTDSKNAGTEANRSIRSHIIKGIIGTLIGVGLMALTLSGVAIPMLAMYFIVGIGSLLTLALGAESFYDAAKKLIKTKTLTMDALFTVSTLTVIGVSIASFFVPWLPMMIEAGLMIFGFRHIGKAIEESIKKKVTSKLSFKDTAVLKVDRQVLHDSVTTWDECSINELQIGDIIRVKRSEVIPVDGVCETEKTSIIQTIYDGLTDPCDIERGHAMLAGMEVPKNIDFIEMKVSHLPAESYLARSDKEISDANAERAPLETTANKILHYFVPAVLALAVISAIVIGFVFTPALAILCATTLLVALCPCILGWITPLAVKMGMIKAFKNGVKFKSAKSLESADSVDTVVFDLNGTLTTGVPIVTNYAIYPDNNTDPQDFFRCLASIEKNSEHRIAKAIWRDARKKLLNKSLMKVSDIDNKTHSGIKATIKGERYLIGNIQFLKENHIKLPKNIAVTLRGTEQITYVVKGSRVIGHIKTKDPLRPDAKLAIAELKRMGKEVHICTGTDQRTAKRYADELKIPVKNVRANCIGASDMSNKVAKKSYILELRSQKSGSSNRNKRVAMIGDASNDAVAIANSDFGIAVESDYGSKVTQQQAGAVISNTSLLPVVTAFAVAKETVKNIKQNLIMSLTYNSAAIILTGVVFVAIGFALNPAIGVALMVLQTVFILLNQYRIYSQEMPHLKRFQDNKQKLQINERPETTHQLFRKNGLLSKREIEPTSHAEDFNISAVPKPKVSDRPHYPVTPSPRLLHNSM